MNIAEQLFLTSLNIMKSVLDLAEFKFGKDSEDFKYFKKQIMNVTYSNLQETFRKLELDNEIEKCECKANLRHGYTDCKNCHGSGYKKC